MTDLRMSGPWNHCTRPTGGLLIWCGLFGLTALLASALAADESSLPPDYDLALVVDRENGIYRRSEAVTFTIMVKRSGKPLEGVEVTWALSKDGMPPYSFARVKLQGGDAKVSGQLDEPGFLQCRVEYCPPDGRKLIALAAAGIDPQRIEPSLPAPEDFDSFWITQKAQLAAVAYNIRLTPVRSPLPGVDCFDIQADSVGAPMSGYLARPSGAKFHSLPGIVLPHGAGVKSAQLDKAAQWALEGFVAIDFNLHGLPNGRPDEYYRAMEQGPLRGYATRGRESRDTIYFNHTILRTLRAVDCVAAQPEWMSAVTQSEPRKNTSD